jgi:leucyl aminopeptidase
MTLFADASADAVPILCVTREAWPDIGGLTGLGLQPQPAAFARAVGFEGKPGQQALLPTADGGLAAVLFGVEPSSSRLFDPMLPGRLATLLPAGSYRFAAPLPERPDLAALSWLLSGYRFTRYKAPAAETPMLRAPAGIDAARIERIARGMTLGRDLVNTPANDMGPDALEAAALDLARRHGAAARTVRGETLQRGFPLIHAVGQAAHQAPRLVDLTWGPADAPAVTLVGKGVTFDTGGLDIKPASAMELMKKDMAGAATALGLAEMVMDAGLRLRLRVLLPVVENAISASAFRPGDIYRSRKGLTVEIGNTDAEGRLVLADALALACEDKPGLVIDFATLTGAARVALGPDLPAFYTADDSLAEAVARHGRAARDPVWRMPLWRPYDSLLEGKSSDLNNVSGGPFAGSITAALFLDRFVEPGVPHLHFDLYGWNPSAKPGRPEGGEAPTARLLFDLLTERAAA